MKNLFSEFQRQPAAPGQAPGAGPRALERWTISPMLPLPKCLISQCFSQRAKMLMTEKMTCSGLALALINFVNFYQFLSLSMFFAMEGCYEQ